MKVIEATAPISINSNADTEAETPRVSWCGRITSWFCRNQDHQDIENEESSNTWKVVACIIIPITAFAIYKYFFPTIDCKEMSSFNHKAIVCCDETCYQKGQLLSPEEADNYWKRFWH
jgi:hypothetical protein